MAFKDLALKDIIVATQADLRDNPEHANAIFAADSRQVDGLRSETKISQFSLTIDEPPSLGGTDTGPNPVELVLAALATCQEITYRAYATALGIPLESVSVKLEGARSARLLRGQRRRTRRLQRRARHGSSAKHRALGRARQTERGSRRTLSGARYPARPRCRLTSSSKPSARSTRLKQNRSEAASHLRLHGTARSSPPVGSTASG